MLEDHAMQLLIEEWEKLIKENFEEGEILLIKKLLYSDKKLFSDINYLRKCLNNNIREIGFKDGNESNVEIQLNYVFNTLAKEIIFNKETETIKEVVVDKKLKEVKSEVMMALVLKKRNKATELIVQYIKETNYIYSVRDDKAPEIWIYEDGIYINNGETIIKEIVRVILGFAHTSHLCNDVINKIRADTGINAEDFFSNNYIDILPVRNGLLNIFKLELKPFDPKLIFFNKLPVTYDKTKDCKNIISFFDDVLNNEEDKILLQEVVGDCLQTSYKYQRSTMFVGEGNNGKSATFDLIKKLFGVKNVSSINLEQIENDQYIVSDLFGKLVNIAGDIGSKGLCDTSRFKELTGGDLITAQRKFKNPLYFHNYAKLLFSCNQLPITRDQTYSFMRRWNYFTFPYKFVTKKKYNETKDCDREYLKIEDKEIISNITTDNEMSGFLNWALKGINRLKNKRKWSETKTTNNVKDIWIRKSDSFQGFLIDYIEEDYNGFVLKKDLKFYYSKFVRNNKLRSCGDRHIKFKLEELGAFESRKLIEGERHFIYEGIKFKKPIAIPTIPTIANPTHSKFYKFPLESKRGGKYGKYGRAYKGISQETILDDKNNIPIEEFVLKNQPVDISKLENIYGIKLIERLITEGVIYKNKPNRVSLL